MGPPEAKIFVKGLPADIKEKEVRYIFSKYGTLISADIVMWPAIPTLCPNGCLAPVELNLTGRRERPAWQACAFVTYSTADTATTAIRALNNVYRVRGGNSSEPISVCIARSGALPEPVQAAATATSAPLPPPQTLERPGAEKAPLNGFNAPPPAVAADKTLFSAAPASATASYVAEKTRCKLFVGNLFANLPKEALAAVFAEFGRVVNVHVMTGKSKFGSACAFVEMSNPQEAEIALRAMHQKYEPRIGSGTAPITVTYFQSQSSGKAGQTLAGTGAPAPQRSSKPGSERYSPF
mmetsp:Transcript_123036/g.342677  ORF Transcript_123036/g.342677 Transcript_123036/m.342677 type:complete len:295 (+) Transcript_123036:55-939(+)